MSAYRPQSRDTDPAVERLLIERLRRLTSVEKAAQISALHAAVHELALAGLRARYPDAGGEELRLRAGALRIDEDLMRRACGWDVRERGR